MAQVNENIIYQPDERPSHPVSLVHGFQSVMEPMAAMAAAASIIAVAGGQSEGYLSWIFFSALVVCGLGGILQTFRIWRFGSGYSLGLISAFAFIAICISALLAGGPALLSSLIVASSLIQFVFISRLSWLRRVISPLVAGTVLMLLASTIISVVLGRLSDLPEGAPPVAAPILAGTTLLLMEFTSRRRRRLNVAMNLSSLPRIDSFLQGFATSAGWNETSINRLRSAGEETLSSLLSQDEEPEENARRRLIVAARRADAAIEMEFVVTTEGGNLEDKLAYMNEQPEIQDEREISFRLLRHYASSVQHHKYHDIDIITV